MKLIIKLYENLSKNLQTQIKKSLFLIVLEGFVQSLILLSILPLIKLITTPQILLSKNIISDIFIYLQKFGLKTPIELLKLFSVISVILIFFITLFRIMVLRRINFLVENIRHELSSKLYRVYLQQDYNFFLKRHSSDLIKNITSDIDSLSNNIFRPILKGINAIFLSLSIFVLLLFTEFSATMIFLIIYLSINILINQFFKKLLFKIGRENIENNELRFKYISEGLTNIKTVKSNSVEHLFTNKHEYYSKLFSRGLIKGVTINFIPNYLIEAIVFSGIGILILLTILYSNQNNIIDIFGSYISTLSLLAFAFVKLKPSIDLIFSAILNIKSSYPILEKLFNNFPKEEINEVKINSSFIFKEKIELKNISFSYNNNSQILRNVNLDINKSEFILIQGKTGSGKSTLIYIIVGLIFPNEGEVKIDNKLLTRNNFRDWTSNIGYVPQESILLDDTVRNNVIFGNNIDTDDKILSYLDFVKLTNEFSTEEKEEFLEKKLGERGMLISGGQRQRIAIARALYKQPKLLILDESTSALDKNTDLEIISNLKKINSQMTIIMISHNSTLERYADKNYNIYNGELTNG